MKDNSIKEEYKSNDITTSDSINKINVLQKDHEVSLFVDKDFLDFINLKIEKLTTAIYMVTSYISKDDPIVSSLRKVALSVLSYAPYSSLKEIQDKYQYFQKDIIQVNYLLRLSETLELISTMNSSILIEEYQTLLKLVVDQKDSLNKSSIDVTIDNEAEYYKVFTSSASIKNISDSSVSKDHTPFKSKLFDLNQNIKNEAHSKLEEKNIDTNNLLRLPGDNTIGRKKIITFPENKNRRSKRQAAVLHILSKEVSMTIREITAQIKGCSEKTIQRELQELVDTKQVKRIGEKRWSKYIKA